MTEEYATRPVIVYLEGEPIIIGEATVQTSDLLRRLTPEQAEVVMQHLLTSDTSCFALGDLTPEVGHRRFVRQYFNEPPWWKGDGKNERRSAVDR